MNTDILREQRVRIDELDEQLICLLAERFEITKTVGELKAKLVYTLLIQNVRKNK